MPGEYVYSGSVANKALELLGRELGMFIDRKAAVEQCLRRAAYLPILGATTDQRWTQGEVNPLNTGFALLRCMSPVMALD